MLKVLFISAWYPNPFNKTHGIFVKRQAEAVAIHNKVAVIHVFGHESYSDKIKIEVSETNSVFEVYVLYRKKNTGPFSKFSDYKNYYLKGLDYLLKNWGTPDLLHVNVLFPTGIAALEISKKLNIPFIVSEHWTGYHVEDGNYSGLIKKYFTRKAVKKSSSIITVTENLKQAMISHGLNADYRIVPNVVNTRIFKHENIAQKDLTRFLHVSSLDARQKNVEGIISAFKTINSENKQTELVIVGEGENRKQLEKLSGDLLNKSIFFIGQKFDTELASEFNKASALVLFSNYENLPVVILEALCCGTPVITTDVGGIKEFAKEDETSYVKPDDDKALIQAMQKNISENGKADRKKISEKYQIQFSNETIGKKLNDIYLQVSKTKK